MSMTAYRAECLTCGWTDRAADLKAMEGAAIAHARLKPSHETTVRQSGEWVR